MPIQIYCNNIRKEGSDLVFYTGPAGSPNAECGQLEGRISLDKIISTQEIGNCQNGKKIYLVEYNP